MKDKLFMVGCIIAIIIPSFALGALVGGIIDKDNKEEVHIFVPDDPRLVPGEIIFFEGEYTIHTYEVPYE